MDQYYFNWASTGSLGTVLLYSASELKVEVETNSPSTFNYRLTSGNLPQGLELLENGLIVGNPTTSSTKLNQVFISTSTTTISINSSTSIFTYGVDISTGTNFTKLKLGDYVYSSNPGVSTGSRIVTLTTNTFEISTVTTATMTTGTVISFYRTTATFTTSTFSVSIGKVGGKSVSTATFSISVKNEKEKEFCEIYLKPFLSSSQRSIWHSLVTDNTIFDEDSIYRSRDLNFSVQKEPRLYIHYDFELLNLRNLSEIVKQNFYKRRFTLSSPKIRYAKSNNQIIYEVVCLDIIDYNVTETGDSVPKTVFINGIGYYPSSTENMRKQLENNGEINPLIRPLHFLTLQENDVRVDGYAPCVIICFAKPGKAKSILQKIENKKINFQSLDFEVDRIFVKNHTTKETTTLHLDQNPRIT